MFNTFRAVLCSRNNKFTNFHHDNDKASRSYGVEKYHIVEVIKDPNGEYFAWDEFKENLDPSYIWRLKSLLAMCFPCSLQAYEEAGKGKLIKVDVKVLAGPCNLK